MPFWLARSSTPDPFPIESGRTASAAAASWCGWMFEQALKGSPQVGQGFVLGSCIPPPAGPYARKAARSLIGTRGLFLIQVPQDGRPSAEPQEAVAPNLSMDDQIARARVDLGIASLADRIRPFRVETAVAGIVLLGMLIALLIVWKRRRTAATTAA